MHFFLNAKNLIRFLVNFYFGQNFNLCFTNDFHFTESVIVRYHFEELVSKRERIEVRNWTRKLERLVRKFRK